MTVLVNISCRMCGAYGCQTTVVDWNGFSKKFLLRLLSFIEILLLLRVMLVRQSSKMLNVVTVLYQLKYKELQEILIDITYVVIFIIDST